MDVDLTSITDIHKMAMFGVSGLIGMLFSYYRRWSWLSEKVSLIKYLFGDWHAVGRALTTLTLLCAGAGGLAYLQTMTIEQIIIAGFGLGLIVPDKVENGVVNEHTK